jgi:hypothetical protein
MGLSFTIVAGLRQRSHSLVPVPRDSWRYFTASGWRLPQPGGLGPCIYIPPPPNTGAQLQPQALDSLFVALYDSQGHGGGIRTRLHTGWGRPCNSRSLYSLGMESVENTVSSSLSIVAWRIPCRGNVFICRSIATAVFLAPIFWSFSYYVILL